ncbi:MAG TPA: ABC transporter permease [Polyangia bacterium]|jgi:phosphonate transport system permease protein|nr:ABC transporter permease [Polyangia bacterium]
MRRSAAFKTSLLLLAVALACLALADLRVTTQDPWGELRRIARGFLTPNFLAFGELAQALGQTVAFALFGVGLGAGAGFVLSLAFHRRAVRWAASLLRSVHELFWALLFLQFLGLNAITGVLAIALPYAGIFAKVFAEILEEADPAPLAALPPGSSRLSQLFYGRLPGAWADLKSYTSYRVECGLRSSAVLGFIGLPTLGFHLEAFFRAGSYSEMAALLLLFYALIGTLRFWLRPRLLPLCFAGAFTLLVGPIDASWENAVRFFTRDIVPYPLRAPDIAADRRWAEMGRWIWRLLRDQALPGVAATLILSQIALVATGLVALATFPLVSRQFFGRAGRTVGHLLMVVLRSTPEYVLCYVFLQLWGPSMLPAIAALSLHNGGIIGTLTGRHADTFVLRPDAPRRRLDRYGYEILPRVYGQFLAFLFYRWEIVMRETAILGILGVRTLGFYVDSAISEVRFDRVVLLLLVTALLNIGVDTLSRRVRARLRLGTRVAVAAA